ncbi:hypothetical protein LARV_01392 [Longilinea arvoryzae]|uniref:Uncharacterized protein n=1 Tax=Longilinea arvoryzae TaxID=360412 RepID=A0A0S7BIM7_9CHLR|nr:hypothetical protein [Longilinea arvoryzae]GAP13637.1 hypothetical protein LARV_01392 [Longilinea arvoryzae]
MKRVLFEKKDVIQMITAGKKLLLAGDEKSLRDLPSGCWIAGTIPYFMGEQGGVFTQDQIYVTEFPDYVLKAEVKVYDETHIQQVYTDAPRHGFSVIIIPASSPTHFTFALNAPSFPNFATRPLIGWVAGVAVDDDVSSPKVFDGTRQLALDNGAVVFHVELPANKLAEIDIVNIFEQGEVDSIVFPEDGFSATTALINGQSKNIADYVVENAIDTRLPLVTNLSGAMINTSFKSMDFAKRQITFYAPVFAGYRYKIAKPVDDYLDQLKKKAPAGLSENVFVACNCILNYLYANLEGRKIGNFTGPITFGEIAYQLLNQTLVYLTIEDV